MATVAFLCTGAARAAPADAAAAPSANPTLIIKNQGFQPESLVVPAGQTIRILVKNEDVAPAEFESGDLNREQVIPGQVALPVFVGPLKPGTYAFFNDFHPQSKGALIVAPVKTSGN